MPRTFQCYPHNTLVYYISRHNVHQYLEFFKAIRESIKDGTFDQYKQKISLKFTEDNSICTGTLASVEGVKSNI